MSGTGALVARDPAFHHYRAAVADDCLYDRLVHDPQEPRPEKSRGASPHYRTYQILIASIAALVIVLTLLIVFSSDPGDPDDYLFRP